MTAVEEAGDLVLAGVAWVVNDGGLNAAARGVVKLLGGQATRGAVVDQAVVRVVAERAGALRIGPLRTRVLVAARMIY
jgi:hypothetical protein